MNDGKRNYVEDSFFRLQLFTIFSNVKPCKTCNEILKVLKKYRTPDNILHNRIPCSDGKITEEDARNDIEKIKEILELSEDLFWGGNKTCAKCFPLLRLLLDVTVVEE